MRAPDGLAELDQQVDFILTHPDMSAWLKTTLQAAIVRNPVDVLNDLEILNQVLPRRCGLLIENGLAKSTLRPN